MLVQFDPFREFDRLAEQLAAGARTPRPFPMDYETGVLTLRIPVAEAAKPRKVSITAGIEERTIEAQTAPVSA